MKGKIFFTALMISLIIVPATLATIGLVSAQDSGTSVIGIINTDTTWAAAGSPYTLTGPTAVNTGVTLTIQPGVMVNLNSYYLQVNGTLIAIGSAGNLIQFSNGLLRFTPASNGWNNNAGTGCIIQYANLVATSISASNPVKLDHDSIFGTVSVGDGSVLTYNDFSSEVTAGNNVVFNNNKVNGTITAGASVTLSNNNIQGSVYTNDACTVRGNTVLYSVLCNGNKSTIENNVIGGPVTGGVIIGNTISADHSFIVQGTQVKNNIIKGGTVSAIEQITDNTIESGYYLTDFRVFGGYATYNESTAAIRGISGESPYIAGNTITGGGLYYYAFIFYSSVSTVPAIDFTSGGNPTIINNMILGRSGLAFSGNCSSLSSNLVTGDAEGSVPVVTNNTVTGSLRLGSSTVFNNTVSKVIAINSTALTITRNNAQGISVSQGSGYITDNIIKSNYTSSTQVSTNGTAVDSQETGISVMGNANIQRNYIANSFVGITVTNCTATIKDNTITNCGIGIGLNASGKATVNSNNIQDNNQNIALWFGNINNVDATGNYWGTTDQTAIGQSIFDSRRDFNLGTVIFTPILTASNANAMPDQNAEGPTITPTPTPTATSTPTPTEPVTSSPSPTASTTGNPSPSASATPDPTPNIPESPAIIMAAAIAILAAVAVFALPKKKQAANC